MSGTLDLAHSDRSRAHTASFSSTDFSFSSNTDECQLTEYFDSAFCFPERIFRDAVVLAEIFRFDVLDVKEYGVLVGAQLLHFVHETRTVFYDVTVASPVGIAARMSLEIALHADVSADAFSEELICEPDHRSDWNKLICYLMSGFRTVRASECLASSPVRPSARPPASLFREYKFYLVGVRRHCLAEVCLCVDPHLSAQYLESVQIPVDVSRAQRSIRLSRQAPLQYLSRPQHDPKATVRCGTGPSTGSAAWRRRCVGLNGFAPKDRRQRRNQGNVTITRIVTESETVGETAGERTQGAFLMAAVPSDPATVQANNDNQQTRRTRQKAGDRLYHTTNKHPLTDPRARASEPASTQTPRLGAQKQTIEQTKRHSYTYGRGGSQPDQVPDDQSTIVGGLSVLLLQQMKEG